MTNKKTRNEQRKQNDKTPPARRETKASNPAGHVTNPPAGYKQPMPHVTDDTRVVHAEESNREDG